MRIIKIKEIDRISKATKEALKDIALNNSNKTIKELNTAHAAKIESNLKKQWEQHEKIPKKLCEHHEKSRNSLMLHAKTKTKLKIKTYTKPKNAPSTSKKNKRHSGRRKTRHNKRKKEEKLVNSTAKTNISKLLLYKPSQKKKKNI